MLNCYLENYIKRELQPIFVRRKHQQLSASVQLNSIYCVKIVLLLFFKFDQANSRELYRMWVILFYYKISVNEHKKDIIKSL